MLRIEVRYFVKKKKCFFFNFKNEKNVYFYYISLCLSLNHVFFIHGFVFTNALEIKTGQIQRLVFTKVQ